jgi:hypothetical protein
VFCGLRRPAVFLLDEHAGAAMRLLKRSPSRDIQLILINDDSSLPYAILSHTWADGQEVTYNKLVAGTGKDKPGYAKIRFCVDRAAQDGIAHCWVDTCCVDKSSTQELQTAINSMFRWYQGAQILPMSWMDAFRRSRWFTRGWTLQEPIAPASVEFFSKWGKLLGSRISLDGRRARSQSSLWTC